MFPCGEDTGNSTLDFDTQWLNLLDSCGALEVLVFPKEQVPEATRISLSPSAWINQFVRRAINRSGTALPPPLIKLFARLADWFKSENEAISFTMVDRTNQRCVFASLIDTALELGIELSNPSPDWKLLFDSSQDLPNLAADERFFPLLVAALDESMKRRDFAQSVAGKPGFQKARRGWYLNQIKILQTSPLSRFEKTLRQLQDSMASEAFVEFPELVEKLSALNGAEMLAQTFRNGIWDEFGWPELEAVVNEMTVEGKPYPAITGFFPYAVVTDRLRAVVVGPAGRIFEHQLQLPAEAELVDLAYGDGQLLVLYRERVGGGWRYWSGSPSNRVTASASNRELIVRGACVELPELGITSGGKASRAGDVDPDFIYGSGRIFSDGKKIWTAEYSPDRQFKLREVDPTTGETGDWSLPVFFRDLQTADTVLNIDGSQLLPLPPGLETTPLGHKNGLVGGRNWYLKDDEQKEIRRGGFQSIDGKRWTGKCDYQFPIIGLLQFPGRKEFYPVCSDRKTIGFWDETSLSPWFRFPIGATWSAYFKGSAKLFPAVWLHCLKVRDEAGSRFLRQFPVETADQLL
ncbi:MAG TPA: hypothetical protein PLB32_25970, partial [Acidobacteriota bacterium]|nr:hypothetical protein [Acidobacteriota bacterium]